jgi:hypothetical protein
MSSDEAARPEANGGSADRPAPPPGDERPRPRYGEYAPPGWSWQPPAEQSAGPGDAGTRPASAEAAAAAASGAYARADAPAAAPSDAASRPPRTGDVVATWLLLVVGFFGMAFNVLQLVSVPSAIGDAFRAASEMLGSAAPEADFVAGPQTGTIIVVGSIGQLLLWLGALAWSIARMRARRVAFWVPVLAGFLAAIVFYVCFTQIIMSDPEYARFLQNLG